MCRKKTKDEKKKLVGSKERNMIEKHKTLTSLTAHLERLRKALEEIKLAKQAQAKFDDRV